MFFLVFNMYAIVSFVNEDDAVFVAPMCWLEGTKVCYWPPYRTDARIQKAVTTREAVNKETWQKHSVKVLVETGVVLPPYFQLIFSCSLGLKTFILCIAKYVRFQKHTKVPARS
jgi:hypothetical protein